MAGFGYVSTYNVAMCGRYRLTSKERYIRDHFDLDDDPTWAPHWNIAPTQEVAVIRRHSEVSRRTFDLLKWGLIPYWSKERSVALRSINAKSETAAEKPAFRDAFKFRRCLIPADGFYEWQKIGSKEKQPYNLGLKDDSLFAMAGLWEQWRDSSGDVVQTFTILTTQANALVAVVHGRMPAILKPEYYESWLDPTVTEISRVIDYLKPLDAHLMKKYPVSDRVNRFENDDPACAQEVSPLQIAPTLF